MAELVAFIGIAASVITLVQVTTEFVKQIKELKKALPESQRILDQLAHETNSLTETLTSLEADLKQDLFTESSLESAKAIILSCILTVEELTSIFSEMTGKDGASNLRRAARILTWTSKAKEIDKLSQTQTTEVGSPLRATESLRVILVSSIPIL